MPVKIFICYAHEDEALLKKLKMHLKPLQRQGTIELWYDWDISPGTEWQHEIDTHLNSAQIILLLISPDFMNSDYCYGVEMKQAMKRHEQGEVRVIPIILRHVYWHGALFSKLQCLPPHAKPVTDPSWHSLDNAFYKVVEGIYSIVTTLQLARGEAEHDQQYYVAALSTDEQIIDHDSLQELSAILEELSNEMVGGLDMSGLVKNIVETSSRVLGADAASLYLKDLDDPQILSIQAATGYQNVLVTKKAHYDLDDPPPQGITAFIAITGQKVIARSREELHQHPAHWGKYNKEQGGREPNAFLGIPLKFLEATGTEKVIGVLKIEDIRSPHHREPYFTDQDIILAEMMGSIVTTVIQNMRLSDDNLEKLMSQAFRLSLPLKQLSLPLKQEDYDIFHPFVNTSLEVVLRAVGTALLSSLTHRDSGDLEKQTKVLLHLGAHPELYRIMAKKSQDEIVKHWYSTIYDHCKMPNTDWEKVLRSLNTVT